MRVLVVFCAFCDFLAIFWNEKENNSQKTAIAKSRKTVLRTQSRIRGEGGKSADVSIEFGSENGLDEIASRT